MKVLILGDLAPTGFGTVTMDLGKSLLERGLDCRFLSFNEVGELPEPFGSRTEQLGTSDGWLRFSEVPEEAAVTTERLMGMFTGTAFPDGWTPDRGLVIGDMGSLKVSPLLGIVPDGYPLFNYCPIEGHDLPPAWAIAWAKAKPVAMSEFGAEQIAGVVGYKPPVIYHGVDTETFRVATPDRPIVVGHQILKSKAQCKAFFGYDPARTMLLRTDRLVPRKGYSALLRSLAPVLGRHRDVDVVLHCRIRDEGGDLRDDISKYVPEIAERMIPTDLRKGEPFWGGLPEYKPWPREVLVALYNAADLYVSNSSEGFGLTIAEALACGVPAVGLDYSAVPEVIGSCGTIVPAGQLVDNIYSHFWAMADEVAFTEAVEFLVTHKHRREQLGMLAPMHIRARFQWAKAAEQFETVFTGAQADEATA